MDGNPITVGQFLSTMHTGSYLDDSCDHLADFLETKTNTSSCGGLRVEQLVNLTSPPTFTKTDSCVLYHLARYISKCVFSCSLCETCKHALVQNAGDAHENAVLLQLKEFKQGALYRPSDEVFTVVHHVEQLFRSRTDAYLMECNNAVKQLEEEAMLLDSSLSSCHDVKRKIICRYVRLRLRIAAKCIRAASRADKGKGHLGSKSQNKKAKKAQPPAPKAITSRPLSNALLVAMDVVGLTIPSQPPATTSIILQPSVRQQQAVTSSSFQLQLPLPPAAVASASISHYQEQIPPQAASTNSSSHRQQK